jgi:hypothetical protein
MKIWAGQNFAPAFCLIRLTYRTLHRSDHGNILNLGAYSQNRTSFTPQNFIYEKRVFTKNMDAKEKTDYASCPSSDIATCNPGQSSLFDEPPFITQKTLVKIEVNAININYGRTTISLYFKICSEPISTIADYSVCNLTDF